MTDLDVALDAARAGADIVASGFRATVSAELKGAVDPVTETDRAAERAIVEVITEARPNDGILAEEGTEVADGRRGRRWVIDPLDGTVNFVHGIPQVAVSVGLVDPEGGIAAVVLDPLRNEEFAAERGRGATLNGEPISVSRRAAFGDTVVVTGFPYDRREHGPAYAALVGRILQSVRGVRRLGSAALDLAWVAAGRFDGYWEFGLSPWDIAAGSLLVVEAGGVLTDSRGGPAGHLDIVASNGLIHDALRAVVAEGRPPHIEG
jgi:myo-inositol-1(or 4)-monophosphatase